MKFDFFQKKPTALDEAIEKTIAEYNFVLSGDVNEAALIASNLETLTKIKHHPRKMIFEPQVLSSIIAATASLTGILAILKYEQLSVLATKALPFIMKTKS